MTPWQRVGLGLHQVATTAAKKSLNRSTAALDRLVYHAVDLFDKTTTSINTQQQERWYDDASTNRRSVQNTIVVESKKAVDVSEAEVTADKPSSRPEQRMNGLMGASPHVSQTPKEHTQADRNVTLDAGLSTNSEDDSVTTPRSKNCIATTSTAHPLHEAASPTAAEDDTAVTTPLAKKWNETPTSVHPRDETSPTATTPDPSLTPKEQPLLKEGHAVPSTRMQRAAGFANLGLGLAVGALRQRFFAAGETTTNEDRLANTLCRMRGAALKLGQMLSIQDEHTMLPKSLAKALEKVRQGADAMPKQQLEQQLTSELGADWATQFTSFEMRPFAAASIGQVHHATLPNGRQVVVKVQYPGVADSIHSDLRNLSMLVKYSGLAPPGLFLDNVIRVGEAELKIECDYLRESKNQLQMKQLVESDSYLRDSQVLVPNVIESLCSANVFVSEFAPGATIDAIATTASQDERNRIGRMILYLCIKELFEWRFMQTDPNWGNFLYDVSTQTTSLIDFGAAREYDKEFVDGYLRIVWASAIQDAETLMAQSRRMGFLTGKENEQMLRAHRLSGFTVGEPFSKDEAFDFRASRISERMSEHTSVFLRHRLTPPPAEVYTLHRKLAGAYMLCIKLGAVVKSRDILEEIVANHYFEDGMPNPL